MFGFGKKKTSPDKKPTGSNSKGDTKPKLNLFGVPDDGDVDNDEDIEDELLALLGEDGGKPKKQKSKPTKSGATTVDPFSIPNYNVNSGDEDDDGDDDDIDDADLEAELGELTGLAPSNTTTEASSADIPPPSSTAAVKDDKETKMMIETLKERLIMYKKAKERADVAGESSKSRRFGRGIKTLEDLLKKAAAGNKIDESDIPPLVAAGSTENKPTLAVDGNGNQNETEEQSVVDSPTIDIPPAVLEKQGQESVITLIPTPESNTTNNTTDTTTSTNETDQVNNVSEIDSQVEQRLKDYKKMAIVLKRSGDSQGGLQYLKLAKGLEAALKSGNPVDLSIFPSVMEESQPSSSTVTREDEKLVSAPTPDTNTTTVTNVPIGESTSEGESLQLPNELFTGPEAPKTIMEALQQRLDKYKSEVEKANAANNGSKARRMGRIVKQYEEAITLYKKGKPVLYDELPTPPGFAPIPVPGSSSTSQTPAPSNQPQITSVPTNNNEDDDKSPQKQVPKKPSEDSPSGNTNNNDSTSKLTPPTKATAQEKQLTIIFQRQKLFKEAALNAKKKGDIDQAREYLRIFKGLDKMIETVQSGNLIDISTLPPAPSSSSTGTKKTTITPTESDDFQIISEEDCLEPSLDLAEVFCKLEEDLKNQMAMCMRTRDHYKSIADVASANRFEKLALESKRDLDTLRLASKQGSSIPKYHYETRVFSITECNTDLNENDIEIQVIQGVNYKVPNPTDVDTYVKLELPYPSAEESQTNKTTVIKDTNNPAYNQTFKMNVNRSARSFPRFIHRHNVKFEVWSKGGLSCGRLFCCRSGFLRSSTLLGVASAKLVGLETKCTVHDAFDILDGRKPVGKLEVKMRLRDPVLNKEVTTKKMKWLSIDKL